MRNLKGLVLAALSLGALAACDTEETACTTDADCGGFACEITDGASEGVCTTSCGANGADCAAGFVCGGATGVECVEGTGTACTEANAATVCNGFACANSVCATTCTGAAGCIDGYQCNTADGSGGAASCELVPADPYLYVAIISKATDPSAFENSTPGADVDAVYLTINGQTVVPASVVASANGPEGDDANTRTNASSVLVLDTKQADGSCELDDEEAADYFAMGGVGGFVVVRFADANEITNTTPITVVELDEAYCDNIDTTRTEPYEVRITNDAAMATGATAASLANWCLVGASGGNGGLTTFNGFDPSSCEGM